MDIRSYKDLVVWQKSMDLVVCIYTITELFPGNERYGLVSQMQRAAVSVPSNIAEGYNRGHRKEYVQFLAIAYGSAAELETQIGICERLPKFSSCDFSQAKRLLDEVVRMLNVMLHKLS